VLHGDSFEDAQVQKMCWTKPKLEMGQLIQIVLIKDVLLVKKNVTHTPNEKVYD